jgi:predicted DNA-binding transcriptional regulator AlpA
MRRAIVNDFERLISRLEFASRLDCSLRKLDRLHHTEPQFPKRIKHGRASKYLESDVGAYIRRIAESN